MTHRIVAAAVRLVLVAFVAGAFAFALVVRSRGEERRRLAGHPPELRRRDLRHLSRTLTRAGGLPQQLEQSGHDPLLLRAGDEIDLPPVEEDSATGEAEVGVHAPEGDLLELESALGAPHVVERAQPAPAPPRSVSCFTSSAIFRFFSASSRAKNSSSARVGLCICRYCHLDRSFRVGQPCCGRRGAAPRTRGLPGVSSAMARRRRMRSSAGGWVEKSRVSPPSAPKGFTM